MQYSKLHQQTLRPFEQLLLKSERQAWQSKLFQFVNHIINPIVFATDRPLVELYHYGLTPIMSFSSIPTTAQDIE
ncbi:MAG: hypothetical protein IMF12_04525, partial [Proteobacteria bacterium]|nr:hypothetical protein [Pseudomonadota bacterium]